ncbi:efflux RND transporter periplasmic adaptor subunit [Flavobacteriaceae bacterium]|nr:efflux RND transporter periplasmic adaptor subunit [Flavobacteriaceae bacterium]
MKNIYFILFFILTIFSCTNQKKEAVEDVIATNNLKKIRAKKNELSLEQQVINNQLKQIDLAISKLDTLKKNPLVTSIKIKETIFKHYLELQGNVSTKQLLVIYPEYSGILTNVYIKEGQKVNKGQLLGKIDDGGLSQQLAQLKIQANLSKITFQKQSRLWNQKIGSEIQYLQAKSLYEAQQQAVNQLQKQISKTNIRAPFTGTIDDVITEQGSVVSAGQSRVFRIINLDNMHIETNVPERHIPNVKTNKEAQIEFPVLGKSILAKVNQVSDFINPANRTFKIEIAIPNKDKSIKPNLTARIKINDYTNNNALLIPQSIVSENANGQQYIYLVKNKNNQAVAKKVIIETGKTQGDQIEILSGVSNGDEIIQEGARSIKDGQNIKVLNKK